MKIAFLDDATLGKDLDLSSFSHYAEVVRYGNTRQDQVAERIRDCDIVIVNKIKLNHENLWEASSLKLICVCATGYDGIDTVYCRRAGVAVCNVKGYSTQSVAQIAVAMVLSLVNRLPAYDRFVKSGEYSASGLANHLEPVFREMNTMTWGVLGLGAIGRRVADIAGTLGCRVIATKSRMAGKSGFPLVDPDTLCRESDILTLHVPLTEATRGMIDRRRLSLMKPEAILVNVARGAVLDEAAVAEAILAGRLGGFGCDVYSKEPFGEDHPYRRLLGQENVIFTPHMAWGAYDARVRCMEEVCKNIEAFLTGQFRNRVDLL